MQEIKVDLYSPDGEKTTCWSYEGKNLREVLALSSRDPGGSCGGRGNCGKCKVRIKGEVSSITAAESEFLLPEELNLGIRLACFCTIKGPLEVYLDYVPDNNHKKIGKPKLHPFQPQFKTESFFIDGLEKTSPIPLLKRIINALPGYTVSLSPENINELAKIDRAGRPALELKALIIDNQQVKYVGRKKRSAYGLALDIGTTSLVAYLADLATGEIIKAASAANMQRIYGSDVISRVSHCMEKEDGLGELHKLLINNINSMIADLLQDSTDSQENIYKITAVGNPVMLHFLLGLNVSGFASAPYSGLFTDKMQLRASALGLDVNQEANLIILPQIGGFAGADTIACLLNVSPQVKKFLMIDIGTNGEIVLANGKRILSASAAAGPAFEGGKISSGMRAGPGAVDQVYLQDDDRIAFHIIGGELVKGICGSGIIDLVSVLYSKDYIDGFGIINDAADYNANIQLGIVDGSFQLTITDDQCAGSLIINQQDIREVQLAKSAIRSGIDSLLTLAGITAQDLDVIYLAGSFGNVLKAESCFTIGLLPRVNLAKIAYIGNAAGEGALRALLSDKALTDAEVWQQKTSYVELANDSNFQASFIDNLNFKNS